MRSLHWILIALIAMPIGAVNSQPTTTGAVQVSVGNGNSAPNGSSYDPVSLPNGNFVFFSSNAQNLVTSPPPEPGYNIYRYSPTAGTELISKSNTGAFPIISDGTGSVSPSVSEVLPSGLYAVAFSSDADNLIAPYDQNFNKQVYVTFPTLTPQQTLLISSPGNNVAGDAHSEQPTIALISSSPVTFRICFRSSAQNLTDNNTGAATRIYCSTAVVKKGAATANPPSRIPDPAEVDGQSPVYLSRPVLSGNGLKLAFVAGPSVSTDEGQIYLYNFGDKTQLNVSGGALTQTAAANPSLSYDGQSLAFRANAGANIGGISNPDLKIIVLYNTIKLTYTQANKLGDTLSNGDADAASVDPRGRFVLFSDNATNLGQANPSNSVQTYIKDIKTGDVLCTSVDTVNKSPGNNDSGSAFTSSGLASPLSIGALGFNSRTVFTSFTSFATTLAQFGNPCPDSCIPFLYRSEITLPKRPLTKNATIEAPADIKILRKRRKAADLKINFQDFEIDLTQFDAATSASATMDTASRARLRYTATIRKAGSKKRITRISSRNSVTIRKLSAGRYTVRYRVTATRGRRSVRSQTSPKATVAIS